jgi:hypothetical protein
MTPTITLARWALWMDATELFLKHAAEKGTAWEGNPHTWNRLLCLAYRTPKSAQVSDHSIDISTEVLQGIAGHQRAVLLSTLQDTREQYCCPHYRTPESSSVVHITGHQRAVLLSTLQDTRVQFCCPHYRLLAFLRVPSTQAVHRQAYT